MCLSQKEWFQFHADFWLLQLVMIHRNIQTEASFSFFWSFSSLLRSPLLFYSLDHKFLTQSKKESKINWKMKLNGLHL